MSLTQFITGLMSVFFIQTGLSQPPYEILKSCIDGKPLNSNITLSPLSGGGFTSTTEKDCDERYNINFENQKFSYISCNDKDYLIISGKKLLLDTSVNMSINPEIKPEILYPHLSSWMKLDYESQSYLCIAGPLSQSGSGANTPQYMIIENAFNKMDPVGYYYFFDKDIVPITSKNL